LNLFVTMLLGGLWHGAHWRFVAWGALHGAYIVINHRWRRTGIRLPAWFCWVLTFLAVMLGLVLFRAQSFDRMRLMFAGMVGLNGFAWDSLPGSIGEHEWKRLLAALALVLFCPNRQAIMQRPWTNDLLYAITFALLAGFSILRLGDPVPFFYFQF
jgi:alginate O-acetyltransferase complex protein AlgI